MRILVEILENETTLTGEGYVVDKLKTIIIGTDNDPSTVRQGRDRLGLLISTLSPTQKIRLLEYHNDEPGDRNRKPCKIIMEA